MSELSVLVESVVGVVAMEDGVVAVEVGVVTVRIVGVTPENIVLISISSKVQVKFN